MLHVAHYAKKTRIPRTKIEPPNANPARRVNTPPKAVRNANLAKQVLLIMSPVPIVEIAMLANTAKAKKTTVSTLLIRRLVLNAQRGIHQVLVVPSANHVGLGRTVSGVKIVVQVNTVTVRIHWLLRADIAQPVTTVTTSVKALVCPAFR